MNRIVLGKITEVMDTDEYPKTKFVIKVTVTGEIENALAFPLDTLDQPEVGEEVLLFRLETIFGYSYLWKKLKLNDDTRLKVKGSVIDITENGIIIKSATEEDSTDPESFIQISNDGKININTKENVVIQTNTINLESQEFTSTSNNTEFKGSGGKVTINGITVPDGTGSFCGIPTCPFTGAPHIGKTILIQ